VCVKESRMCAMQSGGFGCPGQPWLHHWRTYALVVLNVYKPKFHLARHVTSRHAHAAFWHRKKSRLPCRACWIAQRDTHVTTRSTRSNARCVSASSALTPLRQQQTAVQSCKRFLIKTIHLMFGSCIMLKTLLFLLLSPINVIDAVQREGNLNQIKVYGGKWQ